MSFSLATHHPLRNPASSMYAVSRHTDPMHGAVRMSCRAALAFRSCHSRVATPITLHSTGTSRLPRVQRTTTVQTKAMGRADSPSIVERALAAAPYLLPLFDGLRYGRFIFMQFPVFASILSPLQPLINLYFSVPFAGIASFFLIYLGVINNTSLPRYVRFNAMQAVLLDIILILPGLLESVLRMGPMGGAGLQIYITIYNTIFFFLFACVVYGVGSCLAGTTGRLPVVGDAAEQQIR